MVKMKYFYFFVLSKLIIILLINKYKCAVYIPFEILEPDYNNNFFHPSYFIKYYKEPKIFSELLIGTPSQKVAVFYSTKIYELNLFKNICDISNSFYNQEQSSSYKYIKNINYIYNNKLNCSIIKESIYLFTNRAQTNQIKIEGFNIIYSDNKEEEFKKSFFDEIEYETHPNTCINIGFQPRESIGFGYDLNFVQQIRHYKINNISVIKEYDWTFDFTSDNSGYLIIGEKPHEYNKSNFKEEQFLSTGSKNRFYTGDWFFEFDSIYYSGIRHNNNTKYNSTFYSDNSVRFDLNLGLIEGTSYYEKSIKKDFFDELIDKKICFIEEIKDKSRIYYCNKKESINYIEKYFPTLKFCMKQYKVCFEFDYKDLFKEIGDNVYFLVYFNKEKNVYRFSIGQMLIKKYLLTFNYDTKMIGFYDKSIKIEKKEEKKEENKKIYYEHDGKIITIFIIAFIIFLVIGFYLGKKIYETTRKKKANELFDEYEYESRDINAIKSNNSLTLEMKSKYGLID